MYTYITAKQITSLKASTIKATKMVIMSRKKPKSSKIIQTNVSYSFHSLLAKILFQFPTLICLFVFIYIWSTSSTILSGHGVHVCVSSRKLNNLYCLSAGSTQPTIQIPNLILHETPPTITENVNTKPSISAVLKEVSRIVALLEWQKKVTNYDRRSVVSFAAAARPGSLDSIRSVLAEQCVSVKDERSCKFLDCSSGECDEPELVIVELFKESEFCLQPSGDNRKKRSIFDSLISGCIPVVFEPFTTYYKLDWHLSGEWDKYSIFIDKEEVRNTSVNVVERLMRIPYEERMEMRRYIVYELMPRLVYGVGFLL